MELGVWNKGRKWENPVGSKQGARHLGTTWNHSCHLLLGAAMGHDRGLGQLQEPCTELTVVTKPGIQF